MWGGRFLASPAAIMEEINASIDFDKRLWRHDILASKAHAAMLADAGIITKLTRRDLLVFAQNLRTGEPWPGATVLVSDGRRLLTMNLGAKLANVFDTANLRGEQKVLPTGKDPMGFAFSADGRIALVANHGDGSVSVIDLQKMEVVNNFHAGTGIETLSYY